ncbi:MAG: peptidoglycan-binding protein [Clostridiales bacterium]|nr:peptidoglycan-binding protein [Clostridiales bacterium]
MTERRILSFCLILCLLTGLIVSPACAWKDTSLRYGMKGEEVRKMQQALIDQGYLGGYADGIFGLHTELAVRKFQKAHHLKVDGVAGEKTLALLYGSSATPTPTPKPTQKPSDAPAATPTPVPTSSSGLFGGDYSTLKLGSRGDRVVILQKELIRLKFLSGRADGIFGSKTKTAVVKFQKKYKLKADGLAGKKTLKKIESLAKSGATPQPEQTPTPTPKPTPVPTESTPEEEGEKISPPAKSQIKLLHWFNDVKPSLSSKQHVLIYDPATGLSWTLSVYSRGRHLDAEPLTKKDTQTMVKAFGGVNTWNQKGVYVRLPNGTWTIGSTHDMPHQSGSIGDNGFNGHLCVHFLRNMDECKKNDPNYGVSNQETIRALWKSLTGEDIDY